MPHDVRFIADAMLGRLARWLRLLGFDTHYYPDITDSGLLKAALKDDRWILTRDRHFTKVKYLQKLLFITSDKPLEQVKQVLQSFPVKEFNPSRCARCNGLLISVDHTEDIRSLVPEYVYLHCGDFSQCRACGSIYWEGSHLKRFRHLLNSLVSSAHQQEFCR